MREVKFEIVARNIHFNEIRRHVYTIQEIWDGRLIETWLRSDNCELLARREFTGFQDDNGIDIYEGDINQNGNGVWLEVYWNAEQAMFKQRVFNKRNVEDLGYEWQENPEDRTDVELFWNFKNIIGNIYENPELLK